MFNIRYVCEEDKPFWFTHDTHISENEFRLKILEKRAYLICYNGNQIGVMRYNLFWDIIPFLTFIHIDEGYQKKGFGRQVMLYWESEMSRLGYNMVMTSTQVNEEAQHFYRKLGYIDKGGIFFDNTPIKQPQELILIKILDENK